MGGQESIKGYLFQSLIAVLKSINSDWQFICVEPDTELDKIDIIWTIKENQVDVCQVKSSIKNFSKNDILRWILNLKLDHNNAQSYIVYLIGNSTSSIKTFFNSIHSKRVSDFPAEFEELYHIKDKIEVFFEPNNIDTLEEALISGLDKFLFSQNISADYPTKKLISNGMVNQIIKISTSGKTIDKEEFENNMLEWLKNNYSNQLSFNKAQFELKFYFDNEIDFTDTVSKLTISDIRKTRLIKKRIKELKKIFKKISRYNFDVKTFEEEGDPNNPFKLITISRRYSILGYEDEPVIIESYERGILDKNCQRILGIKPDQEFYNFGTLLETKVVNHLFIFGRDDITLKGLENEKEKKELYNDFCYKLEILVDLLDCWKKISKYSLLPIVLENTGSFHSEDIKVQLLFPKDIKITNYKNFPKPKRLKSLKDLNSKDGLLYPNIKQRGNSLVNEYFDDYIMPPYFDLGITGYEQVANQKRKYKRLLSNTFDYQYHKDNPDKQIIECFIKELNTNEKIGLPSYFFIKSKKDFTIEYKITCKNESEDIKGFLYYKTNN